MIHVKDCEGIMVQVLLQRMTCRPHRSRDGDLLRSLLGRGLWERDRQDTVLHRRLDLLTLQKPSSTQFPRVHRRENGVPTLIP